MLRTFGRDRRGTITVLTALLSTVIFVVTAIALDLVTIWTAHRKAQGAADLAAILAAAGPGTPDVTARRSLSDNGFGGDLASARVTTGLYNSNSRLPAGDRFVPASTSANAVRVAFSTNVQTTFSRAVGLASQFDVPVSATARKANFAAFSVGSGLLALDGGVANALLRALLGTNVSLRAMDYNALATTKVDAFRFLDILASDIGLQAADYDQIVAANITLGQALSALSGSIPGGTAAQAVDSILVSLGGRRPMVPVSSLVDLGEMTSVSRPTRSPGPPLNALATMMNAITIANGNSQVSVDLGPSVPGVLKTRILIAIGQRKQSSGFVSPETSLATVRTGQMRALIEATVSLPLGSVTLPIYLEAAKATATLSSLTCPWTDPSRRQVTIDVRPGVVDVAIAAVPTTAIDLSRPSPSLAASAPLVTLPLVSLSGHARATWEMPYAQRLFFSNNDIESGRILTASSNQAVTSITASLVSGLRLEVNGLDLLAGLDLQRTVRPALQAVAAPLDNVIDTTLRLLGVRVGFADVSAGATRCQHAVLVQ